MSSENDLKASQVVQHMMEHDLFSQWLGINVIEIKEGYSKITMTIRKEMINGLGIIHGGVAFSMADSAFAFACNNRNVLSVHTVDGSHDQGITVLDSACWNNMVSFFQTIQVVNEITIDSQNPTLKTLPAPVKVIAYLNFL